MMLKSCCALFAILSFSGAAVMAQTPELEPTPTPVKLVVTNTLPPARRFEAPRPSPTPIVAGGNKIASGPSNDTAGEEPIVVGNAPADKSTRERISTPPAATGRAASFGTIKSKIAEAKRLLQSRPVATAMTDPALSTNWVRIAFLDSNTNQVDFVMMTKEAFLSTETIKQSISTNGKTINTRTIRGNGVNTPIEQTDSQGRKHLPLLVQYPVERGGRYIETAYYMSTHPGLVTPEVVNAGKLYVRNVVEIARDRLKAKGISIQPKLADIAERLAAVEHIDHQRFRTEPHQVIFNDVYTLFALNEGQTYRYSVSSAGAGGMVQMIPSTYRMVKSWHPNVNLTPDFVEGMRNHVNASQAMLLYMQRTWNDLIANPTITGALASGIATQEQLMAAGYNSNPAKLAGYINRGGAGWTNLIPRETQIYLQIYSSAERYFPMKPRTR